MQICRCHVEKLCEGLQDRGLWSLVGTAHSIKARLIEEINAVENSIDPSPKTFNPLIAAYFGICNAGFKAGGSYLFGTPPGGDPDGDEDKDHYCPLCELDKYRQPDQQTSQDWIDSCCDYQLYYARQHGLVPGIQ